MQILFNFLEILIVVVPTLLSVAFMTIIERKVIASMQRRIGPNVVGYYGVLQPFLKSIRRAASFCKKMNENRTICWKS